MNFDCWLAETRLAAVEAGGKRYYQSKGQSGQISTDFMICATVVGAIPR